MRRTASYRVGAVTYKSIKANPSVAPAKITAMAIKRPLDALAHPNCPPELWWRLAVDYPLEARESVTWDLNALSEPDRWGRLEAMNARFWLINYETRLAPVERRTLAVLASRRIFYLVEPHMQNETQWSYATRMAEDYIQGQATDEDLARAHYSTEQFVRNRTGGHDGPFERAMRTLPLPALASASEAMLQTTLFSMLAIALEVAERHDLGSWVVSTILNSHYAPALVAQNPAYTAIAYALQEESVWQWHHMLRVLKGAVGAIRRTQKSIKADSVAKPEDIDWLRKKDELAALSHPNCPIDLWWRLAPSYPLEAPQTSAGQLFLLEAPARWQALEQEHAWDWINDLQKRLTPVERMRLAAEYAERVLPLFEGLRPHETLPRETLDAVLAYCNGAADVVALTEAYYKIARLQATLAAEIKPLGFDKPAYAALAAAINVVDSIAHAANGNLFSAAYATAGAFSYGEIARLWEISEDPNRYAKAEQVAAQAWQWCWHRLVDTLREKEGAIGKKNKAKGQTSTRVMYKLGHTTATRGGAMTSKPRISGYEEHHNHRELESHRGRQQPQMPQDMIHLQRLGLSKRDAPADVEEHRGRLRRLVIITGLSPNEAARFYIAMHPLFSTEESAQDVLASIKARWHLPLAELRTGAVDNHIAFSREGWFSKEDGMLFLRTWVDWLAAPTPTRTRQTHPAAYCQAGLYLSLLEAPTPLVVDEDEEAEEEVVPAAVGDQEGYSVELTRQAEKDYWQTPLDVRRRISDLLARLANDARPHGAIRLKSDRETHRARVGYYRIFYRIDDADRTVFVTGVSHRSSAY